MIRSPYQVSSCARRPLGARTVVRLSAVEGLLLQLGAGVGPTDLLSLTLGAIRHGGPHSAIPPITVTTISLTLAWSGSIQTSNRSLEELQFAPAG